MQTLFHFIDYISFRSIAHDMQYIAPPSATIGAIDIGIHFFLSTFPICSSARLSEARLETGTSTASLSSR